jgi:hypothetical protein
MVRLTNKPQNSAILFVLLRLAKTAVSIIVQCIFNGVLWRQHLPVHGHTRVCYLANPASCLTPGVNDRTQRSNLTPGVNDRTERCILETAYGEEVVDERHALGTGCTV